MDILKYQKRIDAAKIKDSKSFDQTVKYFWMLVSSALFNEKNQIDMKKLKKLICLIWHDYEAIKQPDGTVIHTCSNCGKRIEVNICDY